MLAIFTTLFVALVIPQVRGETVGLYTFDTMARDWDITGGPERFFDSSGNGLNFNALGSFGTISLSSDLPSVAPDGSLSLYFNFRSEVDTPTTDLFSIGKTGELTVEFWYKPLLTDTLRNILAQENGPNSWAISQATPVDSGTQGVDMFTKDLNGNVDRLKSADKFLSAANPEWIHLAFTFDNTSTLRMYRNGVLEDQASSFGPYTSIAKTLRLGTGNPDGTFAGKFLMDDLRISNVALLPGNGTGVDELAWNTSLSQGVEPTQRSETFGRDWVRSHPFMISSWGRPSDEQLYKDANFNTAQSSIALDGIEGHFQGAFNELNDTTRTAVQWGINAGVSGWMIRDEVPADKIAGVADAADYVRLVDPESLVYVSLAGVNPSYIDDVLTTIQPDAILYGFYPWEGETNATDKLRAHLDNMQVVRQKSLQYGIPAFAFIQSFDDLHNPDQPMDDNNRLPSGSELRTELFTKLSAGFKGVTYYLFDLENQPPRFENALLDLNGDPTPLYYQAQQANAEVLNLGQSLRYLESTDWRYVSGGISVTPNTIPAWSSDAGSGLVLDIEMLGAPADRKDAMVGYFEDDAGDDYFMLVNMWHGVGLNGDDLLVDFTITFDSSVDTIWRLNRLTGLVDEIALTDHMLQLTLPGGTGDLFKFDDGLFAGLTSILHPGDANGDGLVNLSDLQILGDNWQSNTASWAEADFTGDGVVNLSDLQVLGDNWGFGTTPDLAFEQALQAAGVSVPEPMGLAALLLGSSWLMSRRKCRLVA
ncbi:MAG: PEP-CTERM sorting domain-containing protein [Phycisphaeraceae bacterium]|nr:PEP-CTERM sorting domain-containing protein [Phycisphaeraceae bacterium]